MKAENQPQCLQNGSHWNLMELLRRSNLSPCRPNANQKSQSKCGIRQDFYETESIVAYPYAPGNNSAERKTWMALEEE